VESGEKSPGGEDSAVDHRPPLRIRPFFPSLFSFSFVTFIRSCSTHFHINAPRFLRTFAPSGGSAPGGGDADARRVQDFLAEMGPALGNHPLFATGREEDLEAALEVSSIFSRFLLFSLSFLS
jgi:hypothetical protein